ncbi:MULTISPECIES: hypothetical protein [Brevibacterium]|uniref:hypothetical protein n=1 Tax=Brevibacterium TaxID=1696 RepID=UPI001BA8D54B|nr:hypothetical protein [Brevibacterium sp. W7.2]
MIRTAIHDVPPVDQLSTLSAMSWTVRGGHSTYCSIGPVTLGWKNVGGVLDFEDRRSDDE